MRFLCSVQFQVSTLQGDEGCVAFIKNGQLESATSVSEYQRRYWMHLDPFQMILWDCIRYSSLCIHYLDDSRSSKDVKPDPGGMWGDLQGANSAPPLAWMLHINVIRLH